MRAVFVDSSIFLHALGTAGSHRDTAAGFLGLVDRQGHRLHIAAETIQEVLFHRLRRTGRGMALAQVEDLRAAAVIHAMDDGVVGLALDLLAETPIRGRDAFIAATALLAGFDTLVTSDARFVGVPGLRPVPPADWASTAGSGG